MIHHLTEPSWQKLLKSEIQADYFKKIIHFLKIQKNDVYPPKNEIFAALNLTPIHKIKVVIIGQDPYHGEGQAHGLAFSVNKDVTIPPSLKNIFKEISGDLNLAIPLHGNLEAWAKQGVLLLNSVLTVEKSVAGSHRKIGWEKFTDKIIQLISENCGNVVFLLWGNDAKKKSHLINYTNHLILSSGHPSPLSVRFFRGNKHFSQTNAYLLQKGKTPISWSL
jgi:uracil-DNA glycosylase